MTQIRHVGEKNDEIVTKVMVEQIHEKKRKNFSDKFKIEITKEALKKKE